MSKLIVAVLILFSCSSAYALDLYFTFQYQSYPPPAGQARDVVFEKKITHVNVQDDNEILKIKNAYIDYIKGAYPIYIERIKQSRERADLDKLLFAFTFIAYFGSAGEAEAELESSKRHARNLGFTIVESDGFTYQP